MHGILNYIFYKLVKSFFVNFMFSVLCLMGGFVGGRRRGREVDGLHFGARLAERVAHVTYPPIPIGLGFQHELAH